jgi:teichuronic acid biosynthesis glycosyltransferase TuaG
MNCQDLVSIVMPVYNGEAFIREAIESVIRQTYPNWELIIVDDGSTDGSRDIIAKFQDKDDRIVGLENDENLGISASRNKAMNASNGEWIAFLDCDDQWEEAKLKKQLEAADLFSTGFMFTGVSYINDEGQSFKGSLQVPQRLTYKELRNHNIIACLSVLPEKDISIRSKFPDGISWMTSHSG